MHSRFLNNWNGESENEEEDMEESEEEEEDPDPEVLRLELGSILDLIRFPTMEHREFCRNVGA
jgi:hypothetical protein